MADGNIFTNSLSQLGAWLQSQMAQNQGLGANVPTSQGQITQPAGPAPLTTAVPAPVAAPAPAPVTPAPVAAPQVVQPSAPLQVGPPPPAVSTGTGGGQPGGAAAVTAAGQPSFPTPGGNAVQAKANPPAAAAAGAGGGRGAGAGTAGAGTAQTPNQQMGSGFGSAMQGISDALSKAGASIAATPTMPTPINMGPFPQINQVTPTLIGRRTQQPIV